MLFELPTVSIIVLAYEDITCLPATLNSVFEQTYNSYEILVFSEDYEQIPECLRHQPDSRLRFVCQKNLGMASTFNQGIKTAKGKYISLLLAGDLWHPNKLQMQVLCLNRHRDVGLIHTWLLLINSQGRFVSKTIKHQHSKWEKRELIYDRIALSSVMIRRTCFKVIGLFDPNLQTVPDWDLWLRLNDRYQFMTVAETLVYCRKYLTRIAENFLVAETDLQTIIEKAYVRQTFPRLESKNCTYGRTSLFLATKVIQSKNPDLAIADNYCHQALQHYPLLGLSSEFLRLRITLMALYCRKSRYGRLLKLARVLGYLLRQTIYRLGEYTHRLIQWMLEEEDSINFCKPRKGKIRNSNPNLGKQE